MAATNTDRILKEMFSRLLNIDIEPETGSKLVPVIDGVLEKMQSNVDLDTVQGQNMLRALLCSMVVHGWGMGMHPHNTPGHNQDGNPVEVKVSKDILMPLDDLRSLRYVKKDDKGRVKKALFDLDQNERIRQNIDNILDEVSRRWDK